VSLSLSLASSLVGGWDYYCESDWQASLILSLRRIKMLCQLWRTKFGTDSRIAFRGTPRKLFWIIGGWVGFSTAVLRGSYPFLVNISVLDLLSVFGYQESVIKSLERSNLTVIYCVFFLIFRPERESPCANAMNGACGVNRREAACCGTRPNNNKFNK